MDLKIFAGYECENLASGIADYIDKKLASAYGTLGKRPLDESCLSVVKDKRFSDGEGRPQFGTNLRGDDIFILQSTNQPTENLFHLCQMLDAAKRASAGRIVAVIPYYGWARQERKDKPRVPISAKLVAQQLEQAGAEHILTMDLHVDSIMGFFDIPVDQLYARNILLEAVRHLDKNKVVTVAPDSGGVARARSYARHINDRPLVYVDKERLEANQADIRSIVGEIGPHDIALVPDDIIDTAGTATKLAEALHTQRGVEIIIFLATHGVLSGQAIERIGASPITHVYLTDSIGHVHSPEVRRRMYLEGHDKFTVIPSAEFLGEAIRRIHFGDSISSLFT